MRLRLHVFEQSQLVEQLRGAGLQHLATKLALEVLVTFEHQDVDAPLGQEQAEHQPGRPAADDAGMHTEGGHHSL
jgi:hypothetical protein